jgi:hypothetical protein
MAVVFVKDQIETGDFISHAHFEYRAGEVSWEFLQWIMRSMRVDDWLFATVFWRVAATLQTLYLAVSVSGVKALRLPLVVVPGNGGFLVVYLLKALFRDWTFSRVKILDLTMLVRLDNDGVCALFPCWRRRYGEPFSEFRCSHHWLLLLQVSSYSDRDFVFFSFSFFVFWLCASVMSRLALDILLLQRLSVICIFLILIYSLYRKNMGRFGEVHIFSLTE